MNIIEGDIRNLFVGSAGEAASKVAATWSWHEDRKNIMPGEGQTLIVRAGSVNRLFILEHVIAYSHEYTMQRWPKSRGPEIASMDTAEVVGYSFHSYTLPFVKVGEIGSAANIQLATLRGLNIYGEPLMGDEAITKSAKLSEMIGLRHQGRGFITPVDFRGGRALLLTVGNKQLSPDELQRLEADLLSELI